MSEITTVWIDELTDPLFAEALRRVDVRGDIMRQVAEHEARTGHPHELVYDEKLMSWGYRPKPNVIVRPVED